MSLNLFELTATLGLDTSKFTSGISGALGFLQGQIDLAEKKFEWLGNAALNWGKDVFTTGLEYDKNLGAVYALTDATDEYARKLFETTVINEAAASTFTTAQVAEAGLYEALAGWDLTESTAALHGIVVTAEAAGEDLKPISDIITDVTSAFHDSAADSMHYGDVLASAATNSNTTITQMGEAFKMVAPIAGAMSYSIEDVAVWLELMADNSIKGSMAGRTLRNFITRAGTDAGATANKLGALGIMTEKLGVQFFDAENNARPLLDVTNDMRQAWQGLDEDAQNALRESFEGFDFAIQNIETDIDRIRGLREMAKDASVDDAREINAQIQEIYDTYEPLFKDLGIEESENLAKNLDILKNNLVGLNDQQQLEYGKQIASLQGIAGLIAVLTTSEKEYQKAVEAAYDSEGAADKMREARLDNLWGDIERFKSEYNALNTSVYNETKGPMREVVQWATDALTDIRDAIGENGLQGGIEMLGTKIEEAGETFGPMLESIGKAAAPILTTLLETTLPALDDTIVELGHSLGGGLFQGVSDEISEKLPMLGSIFGLGAHWFKTDMSHGAGSLTSGDMGAYTIPEVKVETITVNGVELTREDVQAAIDEASGSAYVTIAGLEMDRTYAEQLLEEFADVGTEGGKRMSTNAYDELSNKSPSMFGLLVNSVFSLSGIDGGKIMANNVHNEINAAAPGIRNDLSADLGDAGYDAGSLIASGIQSMLNLSKFSVGITGFINNLGSLLTTTRATSYTATYSNAKKPHRNASAMSSGRIFNRPTVFDYADGAYQVAGDAGSEAVVGTNSLQRMIASAVRGAMGGQEIAVPRDSARDMTIILELDRQQFAKAVYRSNNEETQRVGVRMGTGGAY